MVRALLVGFLILTIWSGIDYVLHFSILAPFYSANPNLWRPLSEMNVGLIFFVRVALIFAFMATYHWFVDRAGSGRLNTRQPGISGLAAV